jgi:hypothetical protein
MKLQSITVLVAAIALTGCASILNEKTQSVNVSTSNGKEVTGTVNGQPFKAPGIVQLTRENKDKTFVVNDAACAKETIAEKTVDNKFFINILSGGLFGSSTDYGTEKMWAYSPTVTISCK